MIKQYDRLALVTDEGLVEQSDRIKVFIPSAAISNDGTFDRFIVSKQSVEHEQGLSFIVDDYVGEQLEKCKIDFSNGLPQLVEKENEEVVDNLTAEQREIAEMEQALILRKAKLNKKEHD